MKTKPSQGSRAPTSRSPRRDPGLLLKKMNPKENSRVGKKGQSQGLASTLIGGHTCTYAGDTDRVSDT